MKIGDKVKIVREGSNDPKSTHGLTGCFGTIVNIHDYVSWEFPIIVDVWNSDAKGYGFQRHELEVIE